MTFIYPAVVKEENGTFKGYFPDLDKCTFEGEDINSAIDDAQAVMYDYIRVELTEEDTPVLPAVSDESELKLSDGEFVRNICVHFRYTEGWDE
jgi:predicted RNase H-like HicB family nuclease